MPHKSNLVGRGFKNLGMWTRGVDTDLFRPERAIDLGLPRPIFPTVGRVAVEKNLTAFLSLDLPGSKVVIGTGPQEAELRRRFPDAKFLGALRDERLAAHMAAADVLVFPSRTDTFGVVQLEALACGVPVVATDLPGMAEVVKPEVNGLLIAMGDSAALARVLLRLNGDRELLARLIEADVRFVLVGGLADWFAVTALFRRPLGLPIPHTAVIPNSKDRIGIGLGSFIERHFLEPELVAARLRTLGVSRRLGAWLADRLNADVENCYNARPVDQTFGHRGAHIAQPDVAELRVFTHDRMICPPSTLKICPVIQDAWSLSRNRHMPTRSSGVPSRDNGRPLTMSSTISLGVVVRLASVSMGPGAMALTRMFCPPSSRESCWVKPLMPTLARP